MADISGDPFLDHGHCEFVMLPFQDSGIDAKTLEEPLPRFQQDQVSFSLN